MFLSELKRVLKDPFYQGALVGIGTYCILLIIVQKSLPTPDLALDLSNDSMVRLLKGEALYFDSKYGELVLTKTVASLV